MSVIGTFESVASDVVSPIVGPVGGLVSDVAGSATGAVLGAISSWVLGGTKAALEEVAGAISAGTAPNLNSTWFSSTYWRVAALAAMLTIPFLCAAAVQAIARADLSLLARVTFGYLPLSLLGVSLAAPLTMLALAATDQMAATVSQSAAGGGAHFLDHAAVAAGELATEAGGSPFFAVVVGLLALIAAMALAIELLIRAAAVYVVVLMLPLAFAAMVWPARRIWAVRLVELLASLILAKFVIVAVLSLAAAAFASGTPGTGELLVAMSLMLLSCFAPWALMRILPFTELAAGAAGILRNELPQADEARHAAFGLAAGSGELAMDLPARLRTHARTMYADGGDDEPQPLSGRSEPASSHSQPASGRSEPTSGRSHAPDEELIDGLATESASEHTPAPAPPEPADADAPFVLAAPWQRSEALRLDEQVLQEPPGSDEPEPQP